MPTARVRRRRGAPVGRLRFATVAVNQRRGRAARQPEVRPFLERIAVLNRWLNDASGQQRVVVTTAGLRDVCRGNELGDDASVAWPAARRRPFAFDMASARAIIGA